MEKFSESNVICVTDCFAFSGVTNEYAVQNLLMLTWKFNKEKTIEAGQVLSNPPTNENMRFGNYNLQGTIHFIFTLLINFLVLEYEPQLLNLKGRKKYLKNIKKCCNFKNYLSKKI